MFLLQPPTRPAGVVGGTPEVPSLRAAAVVIVSSLCFSGEGGRARGLEGRLIDVPIVHWNAAVGWLPALLFRGGSCAFFFSCGCFACVWVV